jgi:hypothetical protein
LWPLQLNPTIFKKPTCGEKKVKIHPRAPLQGPRLFVVSNDSSLIPAELLQGNELIHGCLAEITPKNHVGHHLHTGFQVARSCNLGTADQRAENHQRYD